VNLPAITSLEYCLANPKPKPKAIIEGILHVNTKEMMGGGSKSNKTWIQIDKALSVSSGTEWLGFKTNKSRVLFMNMEVLEPFFMERVQMILDRKQIKHADCNLDLWHLRGHMEGYDAFLKKIEEVMDRNVYEFIIMDPLFKLYGSADENKASDIIAMMNRFEMFVQKVTCALSFSSHFSKGFQDQKAAIDRVSGSGAFARDADTISTITRHKSDRCFTMDFILRNCPEVDPFVIEWSKPVMQRRDDLDPKNLATATNGAQSSGKSACEADELLDYLDKGGMTNAAWKAVCVRNLGISDRTFSNKLKKLKTSGLIEMRDGSYFERSILPLEVLNGG
jgi:hypothetical protein